LAEFRKRNWVRPRASHDDERRSQPANLSHRAIFMSTVLDRQEFTFQAEIKQVLHLLSHSLYQSREIAVRELISNASDALDKMRYIALTDDAQRDSGPLEVVVEGREAEKELVIRDTGIGMSHDELVANLGTIAHSGSGEFLKMLAAANQEKDKAELSLIGQFGVGFYSAFMIADRVRVRTRGYADASGWEWESEGTGTFTVTPVEETLPRGTEVIIHLKDDAKDFASQWRIKEIIKRYSSFVPYPIRLGTGGEIINDQKPIWVEPKTQVTEEQYTRFYQHITHHPEEKPLWHLHLAADSPIQFRAIVYCPPTNLENLGFARLEHGLNLCAKRVLVQSECRELVPEYLRFLRGLVDSEDLPLNVSRETLQDNSVIRKLRSSLVKGVLDRLDRLVEEDPEKFRAFYDQFGRTLKEGLIVDHPNKERIAKLLRFASSKGEDPAACVSLDEYLARMAAGQTRIYYIGGTDLSSIAKSPNLEIFRRKGIEVLYLSDPIDEFAISSLREYQGKKLTSIDSADLDLPQTVETTEPDQGAGETAAKESGLNRVLELFRTALGNRVSEVRESKRLTDSPCCLVNADGGMSTQMQRLLKMANKDFPESARILEVNPNAPLVRRLCRLSANEQHDEFIKQCGLQLWSDAMLLDGMAPEPEAMVARIQSFMAEAAEKRSPLIIG
jgi:molecular chaperone HtpG